MRSTASAIAAAAAALVCAGCHMLPKQVECLAITHVTSDRATYALHRIGVLPPDHGSTGADADLALQRALITELGRRTSAELVLLGADDLEAVPDDDAFRSGRASSQAILTLAHRFHLDGIVSVTITDQRDYEPLRLGLEVELVSCDTGQPIWTSTVRLDAAVDRVRRALETWFEDERRADAAGEACDLYLLSPRRFAEFAAAQAVMSY